MAVSESCSSVLFREEFDEVASCEVLDAFERFDAAGELCAESLAAHPEQRISTRQATTMRLPIFIVVFIIEVIV